MKDKLDRLQVISKELEEIIKYSMKIQQEDIPSSFKSKDGTLIPLLEEEKNAYALFQDVMDILSDRENVELTEEKIATFSEKLAAMSFKPEIKKGSFTFHMDDIAYEILVERRYLIYFYIHYPDYSVPYFMGTAFHFSMIIRLLDFFEDRLRTTDQLTKPFKKLKEKVIDAANTFRPEWKDLHKKELVKSKTMDDTYFTHRDADKLKEEFRVMSAGTNFESLKDKSDLDDFFAKLIMNIKSQDLNGLDLDDILSSDQEEANLSIVVEKISANNHGIKDLLLNNPYFAEFSENVLKKYTVRNKLNQLKAEINSIKDEIEGAAPVAQKQVNKFPLIKDSLISENQDAFLSLLKDMTTDDKIRLIDFFKDQEDAFFKKRNEMLFNAILNGDLLLDDELIYRILPIAFSDPSFLFDGITELGVSKEKIEEEVKKQAPGLFEKLNNESVSPEIKDKAALIGEEIAGRLYDKTKDQLAVLFDQYTDEELPEQIAQLVNPFFIDELAKLDKYND